MTAKKTSNAFVKKTQLVSSAILSAGKEEDKNISDNDEEIEENKEVAVDENIEIQKEENLPEVNSEDIKKNSNEGNILVLSKKTKDEKKSKMYSLKKDNIDKVKKIAERTGYYEGEIIDLLVENSNKILRIK